MYLKKVEQATIVLQQCMALNARVKAVADRTEYALLFGAPMDNLRLIARTLQGVLDATSELYDDFPRLRAACDTVKCVVWCVCFCVCLSVRLTSLPR